MVYGSEAVLPADLKFGAPRLIFESIAEAEATRLEDIDVLEEERLNAVIQSARYQQTLRRYHDKAVRQRFFSVGDLLFIHKSQKANILFYCTKKMVCTQSTDFSPVYRPL